MKKLYIMIIFMMFSNSFTPIINAQEEQAIKMPDDLVPVSPNAASLGIFGSIPVGHYTGTPNISIPIYEINLDGKNFPISLSYHASGIRVSQESSWVGLGWALNAGGSISRQVQDDLDFTPMLKVMNGLSGQGYYYKDLSRYFAANDDYSNYPNGSVYDMWTNDTEPDLYTYNFGNYSGVMFTGQETNNPPNRDKGILGLIRSPKEYLEIRYIDGSWVAYDGDGYSYYFKSTEKTKSFSQTQGWSNKGVLEYIKSNSVQRKGSWSSTLQPIVSTWLLDSIKSPLNNKIVFLYEFESISTPIILSESLNKTVDANGVGENDDESEMELSSHNVSYSYSDIQQARVHKILFNEGTINFVTSNRMDLQSADSNSSQKLDQIVVTNNSNDNIRRVEFLYSYNGDIRSNYTARLLLNQITIDNEAPYVFSYNSGYLPPKHSLNTDHWGYYNGEHNIRYLEDEDPLTLYAIPSKILGQNYWRGRNKNTQAKFLEHGILQSIKYPTGGKTTFYYEPHTYDPTDHLLSSGNMDIELDLTQTVLYIDNDEDLLDPSTTEFNEVRDVPILYSPDFTLKNGQSSKSVILEIETSRNLMLDDWKPEDPRIVIRIEKKVSDNQYEAIPVNQENLNLIKSIPSTGKFHQSYVLETLTLSPGTYRLALDKSSQYELNYFYIKIALRCLLSEYSYYLEDNDSNPKGGGLRIKKIMNVSDGKEEVKTFEYNNPDGSGLSSGILMTKPSYSKLVTTYGGHTSYTYFKTQSSSYTPLSYSAQGNPIGYSYVKETNGENQETTIGYTEYRFHNAMDQVDYVRDRETNTFPVLIALDNGFAESISVFDKNDNLKSLQEYAYLKKSSNYIKGLQKSFSSKGIDGGVSIKSYMQKLEIWRLDKEITTIYESGGTVRNEKIYNYDPVYFIKKDVTSTTSDGSSIKTMYKYPFDYTDTISLKMQNTHMMEKPLEQILLKQNNVVSASKVVYMDTLGFLVPQKYLSVKTNTPLSLNNYSIKYEEDMRIGNYTIKGNPGRLSNDKIGHIVYLWSYNGQYPIAEIKNASYEEVKIALGVDDSYINTLSNQTSLTAADSIKINSLRNQLPNAFVSTYTYKPLVGMLTSTDPNGFTTYYEYDSFGRLKETYYYEGGIVSSANKRKLQFYDYHYRNQ